MIQSRFIDDSYRRDSFSRVPQRSFIISSGALGSVVAYALMAPAPPFPVLGLAYVINGFGLALQARSCRQVPVYH